MSSSYTPSLTLTQIGNGEQSGTWGTTTNTNWQLIEDAVAGVAQVSVSGTSGATLSVANGSTDQARKAVIVVTGSTSGINAIVAPLEPKVYIISNQTTGGFAITIGASSGATVSVPNGVTTLVYCDGTNYYSGLTGFTGGNLTISGNITASGTITASTINASLYGGAANQIPYQTGANATSYIAAPATDTTRFLSFIPGTGFSWQTSSTTASNISGGSANALVYQSSPGVTTFLAKPGTSDTYYLSYNGTSNTFIWSLGGSVTSVSASLPLSVTGTTNPTISLSGTVPIANGGTGATTLAGAGIATVGGTNTFTAANTYTTSGSIALNGSNIGDQRIGVTYGSNSSGLSSASLQLGLGGYGISYAATAFDGSAGVGMISGTGGSNLQVSNSGNGIFTSAPHAYKTGSTTAWEIYSDSRIKENVTPYTKGLAELNQIQIKNFEFNGLGHSKAGQKGIGVIADEIEKVLPDTVSTIPTLLRPTDTERVDLRVFDSTELVYLLVNAVKELSAEVKALKAKVGA